MQRLENLHKQRIFQKFEMTSGRMRIGELLIFCWREMKAASHLLELRLRREIANIANDFCINPHVLSNCSD
jgi:hypothetical protein